MPELNEFELKVVNNCSSFMRKIDEALKRIEHQVFQNRVYSAYENIKEISKRISNYKICLNSIGRQYPEVDTLLGKLNGYSTKISTTLNKCKNTLTVKNNKLDKFFTSNKNNSNNKSELSVNKEDVIWLLDEFRDMQQRLFFCKQLPSDKKNIVLNVVYLSNIKLYDKVMMDYCFMAEGQIQTGCIEIDEKFKNECLRSSISINNSSQDGFDQQCFSDDLYAAILKEICKQHKKSVPDLTETITESYFNNVINKLELKANTEKSKKVIENLLASRPILFEAIKKHKEQQASCTLNKSDVAEEADEPVAFVMPGYQHQTVTDPLIKSLDDVLSELSKMNPDISTQGLRDDVNKIHQYKNNYKSWTSLDILNWAKSFKDKYSAPPSSEQLCEILAIMNYANAIQSGGHQLRDVQLIALLLSLQPNSGLGRLLEVATGEGKSTIVSILASILALSGEKVDVITSSPVLAERDANNKASFFKLFGLSVANNKKDSNYTYGPKKCYKKDIVYGDISSFQYDLLYDEHKGLKTRAERQFGVAIIDEVDSMLIDNGGTIAKISTPLPGMCFLLPVLFKMWDEVISESEAYIINKFSELDSSQDYSKQDFCRLSPSDVKSIKNKLMASAKNYLSSNNNIPPVYKSYANKQIEHWVDNAYYALHHCQEDRQYVIREEGSQKIIVPVDADNTGVLQKNMIWEHGLHQFLQIKHGLHVCSQSITSAFISNVGYFKRYNNKLYGLTGTMGEKAEKDLLRQSYQIEFTSIPTFKIKRFIEREPLYAASRYEWLDVVSSNAIGEAKAGRGVLLICETIDDVQSIADKIEQRSSTSVVRCLETSDAENIETEIQAGQIIVATNIAGRGTDIKTSQEIEANGGLYVGLTFLPRNLRVEKQAFGRTARQGKLGDGQLILDLSAQVNQQCPIDLLKKVRDQKESERLKRIATSELQVINLRDSLFYEFNMYYNEKKKRLEGNPECAIILQAVSEMWALWLYQQSTMENQTRLFLDFKYQADLLCVKVIQNGYYLISLGNHWMEERDFKKAKSAYEMAIRADANTKCIASYHLACVYIEMGRQYEYRLKEMIGNLLPFLGDFKGQPNYKAPAIKHLKESNQVIAVMMAECIHSLKLAEYGDDSTIHSSLLLKHTLLSMHSTHIDEMIVMLESNDQLVVSHCIPMTVDNVKAQLSKSSAVSFTDKQYEIAVEELALLGFTSIFSLKVIHPVPDAVIAASVAQIAAGLAILAGAVFFPVSLIIAGPAANLLITEGISDLILELVKSGDEDFDSTEYVNGKIISYGVGALTMGVGAIAKVPFMLTRAIRLCQKSATKLRQLKGVFGEVAQKIASKLDNAVNSLNKALTAAKKSRAATVVSSKSTLFTKQLKKNVIEGAGDAAESMFTEKILSKITDLMMKQLKGSIHNEVKQAVEKNLSHRVVLNILQQGNVEIIYEKANEILKPGRLGRLAKEIGYGALRGLGCNKLKLSSMMVEVAIDSVSCVNLANKLSSTLNNELMSAGFTEDDGCTLALQDEYVEIVASLAMLVTNSIISTIQKHTHRSFNTLVLKPVINRIKQSIKSKKTAAPLPENNQAKQHNPGPNSDEAHSKLSNAGQSPIEQNKKSVSDSQASTRFGGSGRYSHVRKGSAGASGSNQNRKSPGNSRVRDKLIRKSVSAKKSKARAVKKNGNIAVRKRGNIKLRELKERAKKKRENIKVRELVDVTYPDGQINVDTTPTPNNCSAVAMAEVTGTTTAEFFSSVTPTPSQDGRAPRLRTVSPATPYGPEKRHLPAPGAIAKERLMSSIGRITGGGGADIGDITRVLRAYFDFGRPGSSAVLDPTPFKQVNLTGGGDNFKNEVIRFLRTCRDQKAVLLGSRAGNQMGHAVAVKLIENRLVVVDAQSWGRKNAHRNNTKFCIHTDLSDYARSEKFVGYRLIGATDNPSNSTSASAGQSAGTVNRYYGGSNGNPNRLMAIQGGQQVLAQKAVSGRKQSTSEDNEFPQAGSGKIKSNGLPTSRSIGDKASKAGKNAEKVKAALSKGKKYNKLNNSDKNKDHSKDVLKKNKAIRTSENSQQDDGDKPNDLRLNKRKDGNVAAQSSGVKTKKARSGKNKSSSQSSSVSCTTLPGIDSRVVGRKKNSTSLAVIKGMKRPNFNKSALALKPKQVNLDRCHVISWSEIKKVIANPDLTVENTIKWVKENVFCNYGLKRNTKQINHHIDDIRKFEYHMCRNEYDKAASLAYSSLSNLRLGDPGTNRQIQDQIDPPANKKGEVHHSAADNVRIRKGVDIRIVKSSTAADEKGKLIGGELEINNGDMAPKNSNVNNQQSLAQNASRFGIYGQDIQSNKIERGKSTFDASFKNSF